MLDAEDPNWRRDAVLLLDGARYHTSWEVREFLYASGVAYFLTAPYSPDASPIEQLFRELKRGDLNPEKLTLGKR